MSKDVAVSTKDVKPKDDKPKVSIFKKITRFFKDLKSEFKKIVWPTKKQVANNTTVVLCFMGIAAVAIWCIDWVFIKVMELMF